MQAVCDGSRDPHGAHLDPLAIERTPGWTQAVSRAVVEYLRGSVTRAWQRGWQPAELARHVGRELSADHAAMVADMITAELLGYPAATVDDRWAAQAAALEAAAPGKGAWWGSDADYLRAWYALGRDAEFIVTVATAVETLHAFHHLPALEKLLPLPGTARAAAPERGRRREPRHAPGAVPADERMLSRIRALLAKAESTEFAEEAEALSGRAQELMAKYSIDHALLAAETGQAETPGGRRIAVDNPYEAPKATLLQIVAQANRCRVVWSKDLGLVTVIGFPADLDAVELLFTSLLVQANTAMLRSGGKRDGAGRSRTRAFRQSFLLAYAVRIGERLSEAADHAEQAAVAEQRAAAAAPRVTGPEATSPRGRAPTWCRSSRRATGRSTTRWTRCSDPRSPGPGRSGRPTRTAGIPAAPPPTWPACITRLKSPGKAKPRSVRGKDPLHPPRDRTAPSVELFGGPPTCVLFRRSGTMWWGSWVGSVPALLEVILIAVIAASNASWPVPSPSTDLRHDGVGRHGHDRGLGRLE